MVYLLCSHTVLFPWFSGVSYPALELQLWEAEAASWLLSVTKQGLSCRVGELGFSVQLRASVTWSSANLAEHGGSPGGQEVLGPSLSQESVQWAWEGKEQFDVAVSCGRARASLCSQPCQPGLCPGNSQPHLYLHCPVSSLFHQLQTTVVMSVSCVLQARRGHHCVGNGRRNVGLT